MHLVHTAQQSWGFRLLYQPPPRSFTHTHLQLKQITLTIYNLEHIGMWRGYLYRVLGALFCSAGGWLNG